MGWVEDLPSGRYRGVARNAITGKRWSKAHDHWTEADAWWRKEEREADGSYSAAGVEVTRQQRGIPVLADYTREWAATVDGELETCKSAASQARQLALHWPTERVDEITRPMVRAMLKAMRDRGLKSGSIEKRLGALRQTMANAIEDGHRADDPTVGLKGPKPVRHQHRILTEQELYLLLVMLPGWLWAAALLSHDAGLRISEIAGLKMHRLDLLHGKVTVADVVLRDGSLRDYPKGREVLDVPLSPRALKALRIHVAQYPPKGRDGAVFAHPRGGHCKTATLRGQWAKARAMAGLADEPYPPRWHDLRHGTATALARSGVEAYDIQAILRHQSLTTSQTYIDDADMTAKEAAIDRAFGAAETG